MEPQGERRILGKERHITCVKMSPEHADEVSPSELGCQTELIHSGYSGFPRTLNRSLLYP
jgi:hypothetical protein